MAYVDPKAKKGTTKRNKAPKRKASTQGEEEGEEYNVEGEGEGEDEGERESKPKEKKKRGRKSLSESAPSTPSTPSTSTSNPSSTRKSTRTVALQRLAILFCDFSFLTFFFLHRAAEREKEREETEKKKSTRPKKRSPMIVRRITQVHSQYINNRSIMIHVCLLGRAFRRSKSN